MRKSFILLSLVSFGLSMLVSPLQVNAEQNLSSIKCEIVDNEEVSLKIKGYPFPPNKEKKQSNYDLILIIDDTNKKVMNMYKSDHEFKDTKVDNDSVSFHKVYQDKNGKSDILININRLTGGLYGLGNSSYDDASATAHTYHSLKGTCSPYKIEKKF